MREDSGLLRVSGRFERMPMKNSVFFHLEHLTIKPTGSFKTSGTT